MSDVLNFCLRDEASENESEPYLYRACGIDGVYLHDGFSIVDDGYGESVVIENADELHKVIGLTVAQERSHLSAREVKFLREQMGKTQTELANEIGVSAQMIARYEKEDQTDITGPADRMLRALYVTHLFPDQQGDIMRRIIGLYKEDESGVQSLVFSHADKHWTEKRAVFSALG